MAAPTPPRVTDGRTEYPARGDPDTVPTKNPLTPMGGSDPNSGWGRVEPPLSGAEPAGRVSRSQAPSTHSHSAPSKDFCH